MGDPWDGLSGGRSLHDWLIDSSYVRPKDDVRNHNKKKKGRTGKVVRRHDHDLAGPTETHVAASSTNTVADLASAGAPGKRKVRRWMNERLLRDLAGPLDAISIASLYAPPPWGEKTEPTVLERVTSVDFDYGLVRDVSAWEPFRNSVDMDKQERFLSRRQRGPPAEGEALAAWRAVEHSARLALRRTADWPLLGELEEKLLEFLQREGEQLEEEEIHFELDTAFQRLLLRGLCQFHGLTAYTLRDVQVGNDTLPSCVVKVRSRKVLEGEGGARKQGRSSVRLSHVLAAGREAPL